MMFLILIPMRGTTPGFHQPLNTMQPTVQVGFPFNISHSTIFLLIPARERQSIRALPTVMPNVAGYCDFCGTCYDQIAFETLGEYLVATEYEGETVLGIEEHDPEPSSMVSKLPYSFSKSLDVAATYMR